MQGAYYQEAMDMKSLKMSTLSRSKKRTKLYRPLNISVPCCAVLCRQWKFAQKSRLFLARYKGCTNSSCILSRSYGHEEVKNLNPISVQKAHKAVRAAQYLRPLLRSTVPSMKIRVYLRVFIVRYKGCTNARCILSRSYGLEEFKNVNPISVQKAHNAVQAYQYHRPLLRGIVQSMKIRVHSRLFLARYKGCTNERCILSGSYGIEELKM